MWVASNIFGAAGALGTELVELRNWILRFRFASKELRVIISRLADWMANSSYPWAANHTLMACRLVALDKRPGVHHLGIGETLRRNLAKLIMRACQFNR